ncbi:TIGR03643 family protein [Shewanella sp. KT0246]|uniref:TIGR03643 family protein n=1 Tax=Shewanella sp. KT0246 TaxID=2815912 RepID=UPI001BC5D6E9|nr:TIGR03643 family protein [Shewanella sp. KT0246]GIU52788.1 TIGR03643 family protein [Shewanella sp. KT0246]
MIKQPLFTAQFTDDERSRIIEMAWEDRTPFEAIAHQFGVNESAVIQFMRKNLKRSSFNLWRSRVSGRNTKHLKLRSSSVNRAYCSTQYKMRNK